MKRVTSLLVVAIALLYACGPDGTVGITPGDNSPTSTSDTFSAIPPPEEPDMDPTNPPNSNPLLDSMMEEAIADLADRLAVDSETIEVVRAEPVTWPDGSLGCPQPNEFYTQALVEGYQVILDHEGRVYLYHAGADAAPFLCPSGVDNGGHDFVPPPGFDE